jgi:hypothetical protein
MAVAGARRRRRTDPRRVGPFPAGSPEAVRIVRTFRATTAMEETMVDSIKDVQVGETRALTSSGKRPDR